MSGYIARSERTDWGTPIDLFTCLHDEFAFTIDAAASAENALLGRYWTLSDNAIVQDWSGERVFCNPPYGREVTPFIVKAAERRAAVAVLLVPARTDTKAWHEHIFPKAEIRFLKGRLTFRGALASAPFPSAVVIWK